MTTSISRPSRLSQLENYILEPLRDKEFCSKVAAKLSSRLNQPLQKPKAAGSISQEYEFVTAPRRHTEYEAFELDWSRAVLRWLELSCKVDGEPSVTISIELDAGPAVLINFEVDYLEKDRPQS